MITRDTSKSIVVTFTIVISPNTLVEHRNRLYTVYTRLNPLVTYVASEFRQVIIKGYRP